MPSKSTIESNVKKYRNHATSLNRNKENSGRKRSARTVEYIGAVRALLERNPRVCARDNGLLTKSSFNRITKRDLKFHSYHMYIRHYYYYYQLIYPWSTYIKNSSSSKIK